MDQIRPPRNVVAMNPTSTHIFARLLIWLAALSLPVQTLPAATCGCTENHHSDCFSKSMQRGCCASGKTCCGRGKLCKCGSECQCGKPQHRDPVTPAPVEDSQTVEKLLADSRISHFLAKMSIRYQDTGVPEASPALNAASALVRCISICQLTL